MPRERSFRICLLESDFRSNVFPPLILIIERHITDVDGHALVDAARAQFFIQPLEPPDVLKSAHVLIIVEIGHGDHLLDRLSGDDEIARIVA